VDIISTLILLKKEVEKLKQTTIKLTITGASEAHILAQKLQALALGHH